MKICHVTNARGWSGGMKQMALLIDGLEKRGHQNLLVCPPGCELLPKLPAATRVELVPMFQDYDLIAAWKLRRLIGRERPDMVHAHHATAHAVTLLALTGEGRTQLVVSRRVSFSPRRNPFSRWKYRSARIRRYAVVSRAVKETLVRGGVDPAKIEVIYSAVDPAEFAASPDQVERLRAELKVPPGARVVGKVANFSLWKGQQVFLEAARQCLAREPNLLFVLAGKDTDTLGGRAEVLGISERVRLLGFRKDVPALLSLFDASVNSAIEGEGLSGAMRESLLLGVPVVASDVSGNREIVREGETGTLVAADDAQALASGILKTLQDPARARALAQKGRAWVLEQASLPVMVDRFENLYRSLLK